MALPTKADILSNIQTLRSYTELYLNGQLTSEAAIILESMASSTTESGGGGGSSTSDASAANQLVEIARLIEVRDRFPSSLLGDRFKTDSLVKSMLRKLRDDFPGTALDPAKWTVVQTGAGQSITVASSELRIATGVTANSETIIRSVETYTIPFRTNFIANLTQRIANQEFYLEIVDASGGHYASWLFDGTSTSNARNITANSFNFLTPTVATLSISSGTYQILEIEATPDEIYFYTKTTDASSSRTSNSVKNRQIPDPNLQYYVQIRAKNLATAPASTTTLNIDAISIQDIEELTAEITGGRGGGALNQAIPVNIIAPASLSTNTNISGGITGVQDGLISYTEFAIALGANVTSTGTNRDTSSVKNAVRGWVFTDVSGTLIIEQSIDTTNYRQTHSIPITGNATQANLFDFKLHGRYYRLKYTNGSTTQTVFSIISTQFNIGA